jgi:hypothetical protein
VILHDLVQESGPRYTRGSLRALIMILLALVPESEPRYIRATSWPLLAAYLSWSRTLRSSKAMSVFLMARKRSPP